GDVIGKWRSGVRHNCRLPTLQAVGDHKRVGVRWYLRVRERRPCGTYGYVATSPSEGEPMVDRLVVRGAREHNLKSVDIDVPRDSLIVFTGLSGSGKSSLAFDTIFAEGQRRYVESL